MRGLILATALTLSASMASAEAHIDIPTTLPEDAGICTGVAGAAALATTSTGIGALPAAVAVVICAIAVQDYRWHLDGGVHVPFVNECRPIPDSNAQQGNC